MLLTYPLRFREDGRPSVLVRCREQTAEWFGIDALRRTQRPGVKSSYARSRAGVFLSYRIAVPEIYPCGRNHVSYGFGLSSSHVQTDLCLLAQVLEDGGRDWIGITNRFGNCLIARPELLRPRTR